MPTKKKKPNPVDDIKFTSNEKRFIRERIEFANKEFRSHKAKIDHSQFILDNERHLTTRERAQYTRIIQRLNTQHKTSTPRVRKQFPPVRVVVRNGKKFIIATLDGKRVGTRRWKKDFQLNDAKTIFKQNKSLSKDIKYNPLKKVNEISSSPNRVRINQRLGVWYSVTITWKGGEVTARSRQFFTRAEMNVARERAFQGAYSKVAQLFGEDYDQDIGFKIARRLKNVQITERVVRYSDR